MCYSVESIELSEFDTITGVSLSNLDFRYLTEHHNKHLLVEKSGNRYTLKSRAYVGKIKLKEKVINIRTKVQIANLYYMLTYAYNLGKFDEFENNDEIKNLSLYELLVTILLKWIEHSIKKGLYRSYESKTELLSGVKGKILVGNFGKCKGKTTCQYHELTYSIPENRILKGTLFHLIRQSLPNELKQKCIRYIRIMGDIQNLELSQRVFSQINYHRLNYNYMKIIELCRLIFESSFLDTVENNVVFSSYMVNMNRLFELFLANRIKENFKNVSAPGRRDNWAEGDKSILPSIFPDILIKDKLIIDAKYYKSVLNERGKLHSANLYQILCYMAVINRDGILIYPEQDRHFEERFLFNDKCFWILTIPLYGSFDNMISGVERVISKIGNIIGQTETSTIASIDKLTADSLN